MKRVLLLILLSVTLVVMAQDSALVRLNRQLSLFPGEDTYSHPTAAATTCKAQK